MFVGHYILDDSVLGSVYLVSVRCEDGDVETISMIIMQLSPRPLRRAVIHYTLTYTYNSRHIRHDGAHGDQPSTGDSVKLGCRFISR